MNRIADIGADVCNVTPRHSKMIHASIHVATLQMSVLLERCVLHHLRCESGCSSAYQNGRYGDNPKQPVA
jgi:hypothetical protein